LLDLNRRRPEEERLSGAAEAKAETKAPNRTTRRGSADQREMFP
jgi:hypothetical protein